MTIIAVCDIIYVWACSQAQILPKGMILLYIKHALKTIAEGLLELFGCLVLFIKSSIDKLADAWNRSTPEAKRSIKCTAFVIATAIIALAPIALAKHAYDLKSIAAADYGIEYDHKTERIQFYQLGTNTYVLVVKKGDLYNLGKGAYHDDPKRYVYDFIWYRDLALATGLIAVIVGFCCYLYYSYSKPDELDD